MIKRNGLVLLFLLGTLLAVSSQEDTDRVRNRQDGRPPREGRAASPDSTDAPSFTIVNNTGFTIRNVFVSRAGNSDWGGNLLGSPLPSGQNASISMGHPLDGTTLYNIRLVDVDGDRFAKNNITLMSRSRVRVEISDFDLSE